MGQENKKGSSAASRRTSTGRKSPNPLEISSDPQTAARSATTMNHRPVQRGATAKAAATPAAASSQRRVPPPPVKKQSRPAATKKERGGGTARDDADSGTGFHAGSEDTAGAELDEATLQAQARANAAELEAQLAAVNRMLGTTGDLEDDDDEGPSTMPDFAQSARKLVEDSIVADPDKSIGDVSLHSSDYADKELLQGLRDLDDELEEDHRKQIEDLEETISKHKHNAVRLLKEVGDKPAALRELQLAKALEEKLAQLQLNHTPPVSIRMEAMEADIAKLEDAVASKKQQALAALRSGEKPTALEMLKEAKEMEKQLDAMKAEYAALEAEKETLLHSTG